jgi:hypothetical protein
VRLDAGAPEAACPREGGEEREHSAGGVYCCVEDGGGVSSFCGCGSAAIGGTLA